MCTGSAISNKEDRLRLLRVAVLVLTFQLPVSVAWSQNLVLNADFDTDVTEWSTFTTATIDWSPMDADGNPASGSAVVTNLSDTAGDSTGARQCIDGISEGTSYLFAVDILLPGGQSETGYADLFVQWNDEPGCSGYLGSAFSPHVSIATPDVWYRVSDMAQAPAGAESARVRLSVRKWEDHGTLAVHHDTVEFEAMIFVDGFESGDCSGWSLEVR